MLVAPNRRLPHQLVSAVGRAGDIIPYIPQNGHSAARVEWPIFLILTNRTADRREHTYRCAHRLVRAFLPDEIMV